MIGIGGSVSVRNNDISVIVKGFPFHFVIGKTVNGIECRSGISVNVTGVFSEIAPEIHFYKCARFAVVIGQLNPVNILSVELVFKTLDLRGLSASVQSFYNDKLSFHC